MEKEEEEERERRKGRDGGEYIDVQVKTGREMCINDTMM